MTHGWTFFLSAYVHAEQSLTNVWSTDNYSRSSTSPMTLNTAKTAGSIPAGRYWSITKLATWFNHYFAPVYILCVFLCTFRSAVEPISVVLFDCIMIGALRRSWQQTKHRSPYSSADFNEHVQTGRWKAIWRCVDSSVFNDTQRVLLFALLTETLPICTH